MIRTAALLIATLIAPQMPAAVVNRAEYLMGTVCEIAVPESVASQKQAEAAFREAARVEALLSTWRRDSELSRVNRGEATTVSPELAELLTDAMQLSGTTGGTFTLLARPLIDLWRTRAEGTIPPDAAIRAALRKVSMDNITIDGPRITLREGAAIEEGGFGKGYALDRMIALLPSPAMIDLGGQVIVRGTLRVEIADPERRRHAVVETQLADESISTSSGSEKAFEIDGVRFTHILDPRTGRALPPRGSVSVIARQAMAADILSTALYVMGADEGLRWADEHGVEAIFITPNHQIRASEPCRNRALVVKDPHFHLESKGKE